MAATNVQAFSGDVEVASNLAVDTNVLFVDSVNNKVGIGTTNPGKKLTVAGSMELGATANEYQHLRLGGGNSSGFLYGAYAKYDDGIHIGYNFYNDNSSNQIPSASGATSRITMSYGQIQLHTGGVNTEPNNNALVIKSDGNIGIGTNNPGTNLDIYESTSGNDAYALKIQTDNTATASPGALGPGIGFYQRWWSNGGVPIPMAAIHCIKNEIDGIAGGGLAFRTGDNTGTNMGTRMVIKNNGRVGIGTTDPGVVLDVGSSLSNPQIGRNYATGGIHDPDKRDSIYFGRWDGTNRDFLGIKCRVDTHTALAYGAYSNQTKLEFYTWGSNYSGSREVMCIRGDGRVGIGTTRPAYPLEVNGVISTNSYLNGDFVNVTSYHRNGDFRYGGFSPAYIRAEMFVVGFHDLSGYCDVIGLNTYSDGSGGSANALAFYKNSIEARMYQRTFGSTEAFSTYKKFDLIDPSDDRLKDNEEYIRNATDTLMKLKPQVYDLKITLNSDEYERAAGIIVQDVWYDTPELRFMVTPGLLAQIPKEAPERYDDPSDDPDYSKWGEEHATLKYDFFIPYLIKSIQEIVTELPRSKMRVRDITPTNLNYHRGMVVSSDTNEFLTLTKKSFDKKCFGVVSSSNTYSIDNEILIDTEGQGEVWVINTDTLESGDYLTSSNVVGYAMKQDDDILHNYTVAKCTMDCDFNPGQIIKKQVKQTLVDVTYYLKEKLTAIDKVKYDTIEDEYYKKTKEHSFYLKTEYISKEDILSIDDWELLESNLQSNYEPRDSRKSVEEYSDLDETEKKAYRISTETIYYYRYCVESKNPLPKYDIQEVRQELVNVLDEHGQIQWEDTDQTEKAYKIRYLDANGVETDEVNHVYKAALVRCTYQCG